MDLTVENLPMFFLILVGIGMIIVLIGIIRLAGHGEDASLYTQLDSNEQVNHLEDLFSFFLQEEEKKNQHFREIVIDASKNKVKDVKTEYNQVSDKEQKVAKNKQVSIQAEKETFKEIIRRYSEGEEIEKIAKDLKKGTGEVKLIISLYSMR